MAGVPVQNVISGPWGNIDGGNFWSFRPENKINQIVIHYGTGYNPIALTFSCTRDDGSKDTIRVGGGPDRIIDTDTVNLFDAAEYLTMISGTFGIYEGNNVLRSIKFTTNMKELGPFGQNDGEPFAATVNFVPNEVVGFLGYSGDYIYAIGTYNNPVIMLPHSQA